MSATGPKKEKCEDCRYFHAGEQGRVGNCSRFARFVDHAINECTRDCEYWAPAADAGRSAPAL